MNFFQVRTMFIEKDSYGTNRLIVVDENMQQWVVSSKTACSEGGQGVPELIKRDEDFYFKEPIK
jgi:hypothetical protein